MKNIMHQYILDDNYWGGVWSLDGENYTIDNDNYPNYPLLPRDSSTPTETIASATITSTSTAEQGPITLDPQIAIELGAFSTTTQTIDGLTADPVTSTSADDHATVLPIWYVGP